jgi:polyisoprenyl-phosphate glycosyltransferase
VSAHDRLTIVIAAFDEAHALPVLHPRIAAVMETLATDGIDTCAVRR